MRPSRAVLATAVLFVLAACQDGGSPVHPDFAVVSGGQSNSAAASPGGASLVAGAPPVRTVLAPAPFERHTGAPTEQSLSFTVADLAQFETFELHARAVSNSEGEPLARAEVDLNGVRLLEKTQLSDAGSRTFTVVLAATNELSVKIWGPPGTSVEIWIEGSLKAVDAVVVTPATLDLKISETAAVGATVEAADGTVLTGRTVNWTSSDVGVATVRDDGAGQATVTGAAPGSATVQAEVEGVTGQVAVQVRSPGFLALLGDEVWAVEALPGGDVLAAGIFSGTLDLPGRSIPSDGGADGFVVRYGSDGAAQWVTHLGSPGEVGIFALDPTPDGGAVVGGLYFNANLTVRDDQTTTTIGTSGRGEGFVVKLDAQGRTEWYTTVGSFANENVGDARADAAGNIYVSGAFNGCCPSQGFADLRSSNGSTLRLSTASFQSGFLVKLDPSGTPLWAVRAWNRDLGFGTLAVAPDGTVYAVGAHRAWSSGTPGVLIDGQGGQRSIPNPGIGIGILMRVAPDGRADWVVALGHSADGPNPGGVPLGVEVLADGRIAVSGDYRRGPGTFYGTDGSRLTLPGSASDIRSFLAIYTPTGVPTSAQRLSSGPFSQAFDVEQTAGGDLVVSGGFDGQVELGSTFGTAGGRDGFLGRFSSGGTPISGETFGGIGSEDAVLDASPVAGGLLAVGGGASAGARLGTTLISQPTGFVWVRPW